MTLKRVLQIDYNPHLQGITELAAATLKQQLAAPPRLK